MVYFFVAKIRRLYDIANILASLNLICKVHVTELRGRKPAFSYIGPDVEELSSLDGKLDGIIAGYDVVLMVYGHVSISWLLDKNTRTSKF